MTFGPGPVLLVGCGKMGGALLKGWRAKIPGLPVTVVEPEPALRQRAATEFGVAAVEDPRRLPAGLAAAAVVLAVKPQAMDEIAPHYGRFAAQGAVILSIAAGRTIAGLSRLIGGSGAIVRAMPNTPAAIGAGMTALCAGPGVTAAQKDLCGRLLGAVGEVAWIADESLMDAVTAVSGSGPAYVFLLAECPARAGATVMGGGAMLAQSDAPAGELRRDVTSPGGTTAAALEVLTADPGLDDLLARAVAAAARRSRELAG
jgi:pyrroline-5-carboxylate reductase